jgi:hypothetical protein
MEDAVTSRQRRGGGNDHDPDWCRVTVYTCCQVNVHPTSDRHPERGHQCHGEIVKDGLCLKHLGDKIRLNQSFAESFRKPK